MPEFISDELTHWVGRNKQDDDSFEIMKKILTQTKLKLSRCPTADEYNISSGKSFYEYIVCFTDIPLQYSRDHCSQFGKFGIAFNKIKFMKYGANPVLYYTHGLEASYQEALKFIEKELNEFWPIDEYEKYSEQYRNLRRLFSFLQTYYDASGKNSNYYQREWRISLQHDRVPDNDPVPGNHTRDINESYGWMIFDKGDVEKIIIPNSYYKKALDFSSKYGYETRNILSYESVVYQDPFDKSKNSSKTISCINDEQVGIEVFV